MYDLVFTVNNYSPHGIRKIKELAQNWDQITYLVYGKEVGDEGTPHLQGYVQFKRAPRQSFVTFNKRLKFKHGGEYAHCDIPYKKGKAEESAGYCKKGEGEKPEDGYAVYFENPHKTWDGFEYGELVPRTSQGCRTDLIDAKNAIEKGETTVDELCLSNPNLVHQYGRTLNRVEDILARRQRRTEMTKGVWYYGETGCGKTHRANEEGGTDAYWWYDDNGWWDAYTQQETVILNDFRGSIRFNEMLQLVDKWPYNVRRRGRQPMPFTSKKVIVTSSLHPKEVYKNMGNDSIAQLLRRFEVVKLELSNGEPHSSKSDDYVLISSDDEHDMSNDTSETRGGA